MEGKYFNIRREDFLDMHRQVNVAIKESGNETVIRRLKDVDDKMDRYL